MSSGSRTPDSTTVLFPQSKTPHVAVRTLPHDSDSGERPSKHPVKWNRGTWYNVAVIGICNLCGPGIWGAMNSLGGGGAQTPELNNTANAILFCCMIVSCVLSTAVVRYVGIKWALFIGNVGYPVYAVGLYARIRWGNTWVVLLGAAMNGFSSGILWMVGAAIAMSYPEPYNKGKALGWWFTYLLAGQIAGGAVNLGLDAGRDVAGQVSDTVFIVFIALQAAGPFVALLLTPPEKVQREDGKKVDLSMLEHPWIETKRTLKLFWTKGFILLFFWIGQSLFAEGVFFTYAVLWFSVRARALASFLSGIVACISGNILGYWLDRTSISLSTRTRVAFLTIAILQGGWWIFATIMTTRFTHTTPSPNFDWNDPGFGTAFAAYILLVSVFQVNYMFLYPLTEHLAAAEGPRWGASIIHYSAQLRLVESGWQALNFGVVAIPSFAPAGSVYMSFVLWGVAVVPAWLVAREVGMSASRGEEGGESSETGAQSPVEVETEEKK